MPRCRRIDTFTGPLNKIVRCHKFHHGGVIVSMLLIGRKRKDLVDYGFLREIHQEQAIK